MKNFVLISILLFATTAPAGQIKDFVKEVQGRCPSAPALLIKKSMIEFHKYPTKACSKEFTLGILTRCYDLDCTTITKMYNTIVKPVKESN